MGAPAGFGRASVVAAIEAIKAGKIIAVTDDESRENEGDLIMAGEFATAEKIGFFVRYTSGVICVSVRRAPVSARGAETDGRVAARRSTTATLSRRCGGYARREAATALRA